MTISDNLPKVLEGFIVSLILQRGESSERFSLLPGITQLSTGRTGCHSEARSQSCALPTASCCLHKRWSGHFAPGTVLRAGTTKMGETRPLSLRGAWSLDCVAVYGLLAGKWKVYSSSARGLPLEQNPIWWQQGLATFLPSSIHILSAVCFPSDSVPCER